MKFITLIILLSLTACQPQKNKNPARGLVLIDTGVQADSVPNTFAPSKVWERKTVLCWNESFTLEVPQSTQIETIIQTSTLSTAPEHIIKVTLPNRYFFYIRKGEIDTKEAYQKAKKHDEQYQLRTNYQLKELTEGYCIYKAKEEDVWFFSVIAKTSINDATFYTSDNELIYYDYGNEAAVRLGYGDAKEVVKIIQSIKKE